MKIEFRLLGDILVKTIYVKAGSFDAVTHERFLLMTAITCGVKINWSSLVFDILKAMVTPGSRQARGYAIQICVLLKNVPSLELGESRAFPSSRILTEKTVHRYVVINEKVGGEEVADAPRVKKTPVKKAASNKRPAIDAAAEPVVKKKRTTKSKSVSSKDTLDIFPVAQDAVPLQMIVPTPVAPTEQPPVPKRKTQKRRRKLILSPDDEIVDSEPVV
ncbi:patatin-like protein 2 [Dorcoceras hygrometricum]|uniref:Patatin-like protein 2 n=1 Tax=Dorcoceras hygrometricum TaxID=472368 RepID=A0A2Z7DG34_9LAMI|nr:patatin-like protein 2 [Dorcoceras hygrometricum]